MTLAASLARARGLLAAAGFTPEDAALDADVLARHILHWDRARLVSRSREEPPAGFDAEYARLVARRVNREPVAYITGTREFWGLDFEVTPDVLVPRPETELIVEEALRAFSGRAAPRLIVDVGTGSGCLAVALALEFPTSRIVATDISEAALAVARRNAVRHGAAGRMQLEVADLMPAVRDADLIVANLPYVAESDASCLPPDVRDHEPAAALFAGADGLNLYRRLLPLAVRHAAPDGVLVLEVGYDQHAAVAALAEAAGWHTVTLRRDLQGIPRTLVSRHTP